MCLHEVCYRHRYDSQETLALMDGVVDIYMPDMKYADSTLGKRYSHVKNYPAINQAAVKEMHRQVGHCLGALQI